MHFLRFDDAEIAAEYDGLLLVNGLRVPICRGPRSFLGLMSAEIGPLGQNETFQISLFCSALVIVFFLFCALVIVFCISLQCKRNNNLSTLQPEKASKEY